MDQAWFHITTHTYAAWLSGDLRGFRTRHHREHVEGDYKNPPPPEMYADKRLRSEESLKQEPVKLSAEMRAVVGAALRERLIGLGAEVIAISMSATHAHILAKVPDSKDIQRDWMGLAKKHAWFLARDKGYKRIRGRLPQNSEIALSFLSSIGALVPIYNPEARFELPLV